MDTSTISPISSPRSSRGEDLKSPWTPREGDALIPEEPEELFDRIVRNAKTHSGIAGDVWGGTFYVIIKDFPDIASGQCHSESMLRAAFTMTCYVMNIVLQMLMLWYIIMRVALPAVLQVQDLYQGFHSSSFVDGKFDRDVFDESFAGERGDLCQIALSTKAFLAIILFLWVAACSMELKNIIRLITDLRCLPELPDKLEARHMVSNVEDGNEHVMLIVCLNTPTRFWIYALIILPRLFVVIVLCSTGCFWLMASDSFADLILNSLALRFVVEIDELIFTVFLPARFSKTIAATQIAMPRDMTISDEERVKQDILNAYVRSTIYLLGCAMFVFAMLHFQFILPSYQWDVKTACAAYLSEQVPWCMPWHSQCFPIGS